MDKENKIRKSQTDTEEGKSTKSLEKLHNKLDHANINTGTKKIFI